MSMQAFYSQFVDYARNNRKLFSLLINMAIGLLLGFSVYFIYRTYIAHREQKAELMLSESLAEFQKAIRLELSGADSKAIENAWDEVQSIFQLGQDKNKSAALSAYMGVFNAQALARLGKLDEAKAVLADALNKLDYSPYSGIYKTFEALLLIESNDNTTVLGGEEQLRALASDMTNPQRDMALYFLGCYQLSKGDREGAVISFRTIDALSSQVASSWQPLAEKHLAGLYQYDS